MGVSHAESLENKAFWWGLGHSSPVSRSGFEQKRTSIKMFFFCSSRAQESPAPAQNFVLAGSENSPPDCFPSRAY